MTGRGSTTRPKTAFARRAEFYDQIVADPELSRAAIAVAWRLVNHINDKTGECFPSLERLARQLNIHKRTVRRGVDQLIAAGWFTKKRRGRGGTQYFANYENRTEISPFSGEGNWTDVSRKDNMEMQTSLSKNQDRVVKKRGTEPSSEPKEEPPIEPQGSPPLVPPNLFDNGDRPARRDVIVADDRNDVGKAVEFWNTMAAENGLPQVQRITETRHRKLRRRLAECGGLEGWRVALAKVAESEFLKGNGPNGWRADFDFILQQSSFTWLLEGVYDSPLGGQRGTGTKSAAMAEAFDDLDFEIAAKRARV